MPDINNFVSGAAGTSGTKSAKIFQEIDDPGLNRQSPLKNIEVP